MHNMYNPRRLGPLEYASLIEQSLGWTIRRLMDDPNEAASERGCVWHTSARDKRNAFHRRMTAGNNNVY